MIGDDWCRHVNGLLYAHSRDGGEGARGAQRRNVRSDSGGRVGAHGAVVLVGGGVLVSDGACECA